MTEPKPTQSKSRLPNRKYGWHRELPDARDYRYKLRVAVKQSLWQRFINWLKSLWYVKPVPTPSPTPTPPGPLPASYDMRICMPPIVDQGNLGSCTANALAGAIGFLEIKDGLQKPETFTLPFSRLYIYYNERAIEGTIPYDWGANLRDGIKSMSQGNQGACYESTWPYFDLPNNQFATQPSLEAYTEGQAHEILVYEKLDDPDPTTMLTNLKDCLASCNPFVFGFTVYLSFETFAVESTGIVPMPAWQSGEQVVGGHAVLCVGYDDANQWFICRNSWGNWGDKGYFYMPYEYLTNQQLSSDFWTISKGELMAHKP